MGQKQNRCLRGAMNVARTEEFQALTARPGTAEISSK
jgi:hypothetical protein